MFHYQNQLNKHWQPERTKFSFGLYSTQANIVLPAVDAALWVVIELAVPDHFCKVILNNANSITTIPSFGYHKSECFEQRQLYNYYSIIRLP